MTTIAFRIALRFLSSKKSQTVLIALGLAIAISVQIFVGILISSLQVGLVDAVTGSSPHVTIEHVEKGMGIVNWEELAQRIETVDSVTGVTASAFSYALVSFEGNNVSAGIRGLDLPTAEPMYGIGGSLVGDGRLPESNTEILVGAALNRELGILPGKALRITNWDLSLTELTVTGIYEFGNEFADSGIITTLDRCQYTFNLGTEVDAVEVQVSDVFTADSAAADITILLNDATLKVTNWKETNADLLNALQSQSLSSYMIQAFVLISVVIAIASVLAITVLQKSRQIGILKAMGIRDSAASMIFLYQGLLLGIFGAIGGILIGLFLLYGFIFGASSGSEEPLIELIIDFRFIALFAIIAVTSAVVASLLPARRSSKLSPVEVIRNG